MHIPMNAATHRPGHPANRAGRLGRFLLRQLFLGLLQLFTPLFHAELAGGGLFLLALVPELRRRKLRFSFFGGAAAKIRPLRCSSSPHKVI